MHSEKCKLTKLQVASCVFTHLYQSPTQFPKSREKPQKGREKTVALLSMASSGASVRPRVATESLTPHKTQPATRLRFRFYIRHFSYPMRPCATQLYIVYYFFNFYFIYIRYAYTHTHAKGKSKKVAGCGLRFWSTSQPS